MSSNKQEVCLNPELDQISVSLHGTIETTEDGMTYRLIQVDSMKEESNGVDHHSLSPILQPTPEYSEKTTSLMNEALNGEFYVLHPTSELFTSVPTTRPTSKPIANTSRNAIRVRDERKRASHNEVERRRRDKINTWILKLGTLIPEEGCLDKNVECQSLRSKGGILAKAYDHIVELRTKNQYLEKYIKANEQLVSKLDKLSKQNLELKYTNNVLKNMLLENGLIVETSNNKKEDSNPS